MQIQTQRRSCGSGRMFSKRFYVKINLQLHAITCPGVWLCSHGYLEVTIKTLGYYFRTGAMEPRFPLLCHDQFNIEGYFRTVRTIEQLQRVLSEEPIDITLWQNGRRLAYYQGKIDHLMRRMLPELTCPHDVNVQLLMKATPAFPGIIAPKLELSAKMYIQNRQQQPQHQPQATNAGAASSSAADTTATAATRHKPLPHYEMPNFEFAPMRTFNRHYPGGQSGLPACHSQVSERRRQQPVCHSNGTLMPHCGAAHATSFHTNKNNKPSSSVEQRRYSTCSSHCSGSTATFVSNASSGRIGSGCCHTRRPESVHDDHDAIDNHPPCCEICHSYRSTFL